MSNPEVDRDAKATDGSSAKKEDRADLIARGAEPCAVCGALLMAVHRGGQKTRDRICLTCRPPMGICPFCSERLRGSSSSMCRKCRRRWTSVAGLSQPNPKWHLTRRCDTCGDRSGDVRSRTFYHCIGLVVAISWSKVEGDMCGSCAAKRFWLSTAITLTIGLPSIFSVLLVPIFVGGNIFTYVNVLRDGKKLKEMKERDRQSKVDSYQGEGSEDSGRSD